MAVEIKFISNKKLDRTVIVDDIIYAPSDDGATRLPRRLINHLGLNEIDVEVEEEATPATVTVKKKSSAVRTGKTRTVGKKVRPVHSVETVTVSETIEPSAHMSGGDGNKPAG